MLTNRVLALAATCGIALSSFGVANAQTAAAPGVTTQLPAGTTLSTQPAGTVPLSSPASPASMNATKGAQIVSGVTGSATSSTPGALGENGLPSIENASAGNVTGLLSYCIHKKVINSTTARSTARSLAKRDDVKADQGYSIGGQGLLQNGTSTPFDIATLDKSKRVELCSDLVKRGQSLSN